MSVLFSPWGNQQFSASGTALASGHKIYTYAAGSSTPLATYTDSTGAVAQSNPIILNTLGLPTNGQIWLTSGLAYKLVWKDANDVPIDDADDITGVTGAASVSQWQASGQTPTYVSASVFTLSGDQTSTFQVNRRLQFTVGSGTVYGTILSSAYGVLTTVTMTMDPGDALDVGLSSVSYGLLTADDDSIPRGIFPTSSDPYIYIRDEKTNGTAGGSSTALTYITRTLNTKVSDAGSLASLASNQITLSAGTYRLRIRAPALQTNQHRARLRNVTAGTTIALGSSCISSSANTVSNDSIIVGQFTIAAGQALEVQHYSVSAGSFGSAVSSGEAEIYTEVEFWKEF